MSTFDELMNQLNDEDDTFESELLSLIDSDYSMYSEADIDKDTVADAKKVYNKAKKIKKACIIALALVAAIIAGAAIYKKAKKDKILRDSYHKAGMMYGNSKKEKKWAADREKEKKVDQYIAGQQEAEKYKGQLTSAIKKLEKAMELYPKVTKSGNEREYNNWISTTKTQQNICSDLLKKIVDLGGTFDDSKINSLTDRLSAIVRNEESLKMIGASGDTVVSGYNDFMENAVTEYLDDNISFTELCALSVKASQKFDDSSYNESAYDDEYSRIVDSICEKYNNDELSPDDTVLLLEKAAEKYLG